MDDDYNVRDVVMGNLGNWAEGFKGCLKEFVNPSQEYSKIKIGNMTFAQLSCYQAFFFFKQVEDTAKEGPKACELTDQDYNQVKLWEAQMKDELKLATGDAYDEWYALVNDKKMIKGVK